MRRPSQPLSQSEFVVLTALMISIVAMATDIMLPALGVIGTELGVADPNDAQLIVSSLFAGFAVGQLFAGPISDTFGRKPTIYIGYSIFTVGCVISLLADDLTYMLVGRFLQGLGAAPCRIITVAIVRDLYSGRPMAKIMSISMSVFILVPAIAPAIGQVLIAFFPWHSNFVFLIGMAVVSFAWFGLRQPETLTEEHRRAFSITEIVLGLREIVRTRQTMGYTLASGCVFGFFLGYLSSSQQIFQTTYGTGQWFALYFGMAALAIGAASIMNSTLVMRFGMRYLSTRSLIALTLLAAALVVPSVLVWDGVPPFWVFMGWLMATFFCIGMLFGNFNALAMEPLGHMAGLGSAFIGSLSSIMSLPVGWLVGYLYDGTVLPLVGGFALLGCLALVVVAWTNKVANDATA